MIDHECRIVTPVLNKILKSKLNTEKILNKKIEYLFLRKKKFQNYYLDYFDKAKLVKEIFFRGLPINNKKKYFLQEEQLYEEFNKTQLKLKSHIIGKQIVQIPNPDFVSFREFEKNFKNLYFRNKSRIVGLELIASWHGKNCNDSDYNKFFSFVSEMGLPLSIEVDYLFRKSLDSLHYFFRLIEKFPKIQYWLPHLGCGIFLHWNKVIDICNVTPKLLTSTTNYSDWSSFLMTKNLKKINILFASDHPFNNFSSFKIYKDWIKLSSK